MNKIFESIIIYPKSLTFVHFIVYLTRALILKFIYKEIILHI